MTFTPAAGPRARVERLLGIAREVVAIGALERSRLCARWVPWTGLSLEGVEWALDHCLELQPSSAELEAMIAAAPRAERAHVILPAQVFVAPLRALALALAAAPRVSVRPSRRDPTLIAALAARAAGLFECVEQLTVQPGDHVWAYGADLTLAALRRQLPAGAFLHAHGTGFGVAIVAVGAPQLASLAAQAAGIVRDTLCFDQRGCASPRLVLALGGDAGADALAGALADALADAGRRVPRGVLTPDERAEESWYRQCMACFAPLIDTGHGSVSVRRPELALGSAPDLAALLLPPAGRHLQIVPIERLEPALAGLAPWLTSVGCSEPALEARARAVLPRARVCALGQMQTPAFDGPVDRRSDPAGELL
jgi:Acyl-CoA reductase (LuxC)